MRILVIAPRFPWPPDKGDRLTIYHYLRVLSQQHELALATFVAGSERAELHRIEPFVKKCVLVDKPLWDGAWRTSLALPSNVPLQVAYYSSKLMQVSVAELVREFQPEAIYCHLLRMAPYALPYRSIPTLLGLQISMALNYRRLVERSRNPLERAFYGLELARVKAYEAEMADAFGASVLISPNDLEEMRRSSGRALNKVHLLAHGVDEGWFKPNPEATKQPNTLVMTGNMAYPPNRDAVLYMVHEVLPLVRREIPDVHFYAVGKNPGQGLLALHDGKQVTVTGEVPDTRPYLWQSSVAVVPVRVAAGLQNKLLEAMSAGIPTVATPEANEGIRAKPGDEVLLGATPAEFAKHVVGLLRDPEAAATLAANGRKFIEREFTWDYFLEQLVNVIEGLRAGSQDAARLK